MRIAKKRRLRKVRALSPIIANMLLIALVVTAGALTFSTVFLVMTTKDPITLTIRDVNDFKLTNTTPSTKYNAFTILVENSGTRGVGILNSSITIYNQADMSVLPSWVMESDQEIPSQLSQNIYLHSTSLSGTDWLSINDTITIEISIYALDTEYASADKLNIKKDIKISKDLANIGPIVFSTNNPVYSSNNVAINISDTNNNSLELEVLNYGALDVNYTIELIASNRTLNLSLSYIGSVNDVGNYISDSIQGALGNIPTSSSDLNPSRTLVLTITNKTAIISGVDEFYVTAWLKIKSKIYDTLFIICKT